ncbi:unnamed protein product, partial [Trichogramma brassicae]
SINRGTSSGSALIYLAPSCSPGVCSCVGRNVGAVDEFVSCDCPLYIFTNWLVYNLIPHFGASLHVYIDESSDINKAEGARNASPGQRSAVTARSKNQETSTTEKRKYSDNQSEVIDKVAKLSETEVDAGASEALSTIAIKTEDGHHMVDGDGEEFHVVTGQMVDGSPLGVVTVVPGVVDDNSMASLTNVESDANDRMSEDDDDDNSSESEAYEDGDLLSSAMDDDVTAQLAAAGWHEYNDHAANDGSVSLIQVDPTHPIITLPDGTTAQVQGVAT